MAVTRLLFRRKSFNESHQGWQSHTFTYTPHALRTKVNIMHRPPPAPQKYDHPHHRSSVNKPYDIDEFARSFVIESPFTSPTKSSLSASYLDYPLAFIFYPFVLYPFPVDQHLLWYLLAFMSSSSSHAILRFVFNIPFFFVTISFLALLSNDFRVRSTLHKSSYFFLSAKWFKLQVDKKPVL